MYYNWGDRDRPPLLHPGQGLPVPGPSLLLLQQPREGGGDRQSDGQHFSILPPLQAVREH